MLSTIREFSHCSIANQLSVMTLEAIKSLLDIVDLVSMQKFIMNEFKERREVVV